MNLYHNGIICLTIVNQNCIGCNIIAFIWHRRSGTCECLNISLKSILWGLMWGLNYYICILLIY